MERNGKKWKDMDMCDNAQCKAKDTCARYIIYQSMKGMYAPFAWVMTRQEDIDKCAAYLLAPRRWRIADS